MEINKSKGVIEAILFAAGREVKITELMSALEASSEEVITLVESMKEDYKNENRGLQIVNVGEAYQLCTKQEYYEYLYTIFDKRNKPNLSLLIYYLIIFLSCIFGSIIGINKSKKEN